MYSTLYPEFDFSLQRLSESMFLMANSEKKEYWPAGKYNHDFISTLRQCKHTFLLDLAWKSLFLEKM